MDTLDPDRFDPRELVALQWTRSFFQENGKPNIGIQGLFETTLTPEEQELIAAAVKGIFVVNLTSNTVRLWLERLISLLKRRVG